MAHPSTITHWLQQPATFSAEDKKELAALLKRYPYFVPARYLRAAAQHKAQPFAPAMLEHMRLYQGNWMKFYEFLQSAAPAEDVIVAPVAQQPKTAATAKPENTPPDPQAAPADKKEELILDDEMDFEFGEEQLEKLYVQADEKKKKPAVEDPEPEAPAVEEPEPQEPEQEEQPPVKKSGIPKPQEASRPAANNRKGTAKNKDEQLIQPIYSEDYFLHQGIQVSEDLPVHDPVKQEEKSLMVVMSFTEWLMHFKTKGEREKEEQKDQKALKMMWQKEKLAAALEEENEEIPEEVFEMAVNSITKEEDLVSEPLAEILVKQGKYDKAIEMYKKLSLRNPQKNTYFARKIEDILKEIES